MQFTITCRSITEKLVSNVFTRRFADQYRSDQIASSMKHRSFYTEESARRQMKYLYTSGVRRPVMPDHGSNTGSIFAHPTNTSNPIVSGHSLVHKTVLFFYLSI